MPGFAVEVAGDAGSGLDLALSTEYDAILLDIMLPGKNGFELLKELRKRASRVPVLILTARSSVEDRVCGLNLGADDYLPKPFDFHELLAQLRGKANSQAVGTACQDKASSPAITF